MSTETTSTSSSSLLPEKGTRLISVKDLGVNVNRDVEFRSVSCHLLTSQISRGNTAVHHNDGFKHTTVKEKASFAKEEKEDSESSTKDARRAFYFYQTFSIKSRGMDKMWVLAVFWKKTRFFSRAKFS